MVKSKVFISNQELIMHGCKSCPWKSNNQCPYGLSDEEFYSVKEHSRNKDQSNEVEGICPEFSGFIFSLAEGEDSISAVWEKYHLYLARLQSLGDYAEFQKLNKELLTLEAEGETDPKQLEILQMKRNGYKLWWSRLNMQVMSGLKNIVDREKRMEDVSVGKKLTVQQLNVIINQSAKKVLESDTK